MSEDPARPSGRPTVGLSVEAPHFDIASCEFAEVLATWINKQDIEPLLNFIRSDRPLTTEVRSNLANLIEMLDARTRPRPEGRPRGKQARWRNPNYWAADHARAEIERWKTGVGQKRIPAAKRKELVRQSIDRVKQWVGTKKFNGTLSFETVLELLRKSRNRSR